jgi:hypothetical protein
MGLKNVIAEFFSAESGQERRQWLTGKEEQFGNALDYALGPDLAPRVNALAQAGAMVSPGADVMEAQQAGRDMFAPDRSPLDRAASGAAMVGAGAMMLMPGGASSVRQGVESVVDAGARAYDPSQVNALRLTRRGDYAGSHTAPSIEPGATLDNPADIFGDDIYGGNAARYFGTGDDFADKRSIEAIQSARNNPNAELTVFRAVPSGAPDDINAGDWVTTSEKYAQGHGESALGGDYKVVQEVVRAQELATDGNSVNEWGWWPDDARKAADAPATPAQEIARLLSEGRANEVTDELYAQADPQELHQLYTSGATGVDMPMDTPSRMARADEMGFGGDMYHGSNANFSAFDPNALDATGQKVTAHGEGTYLSEAPRLAERYASRRDGGQMYPVRENMENPWTGDMSVSDLSPEDLAVYMAAESGPEALGFSGKRNSLGISVVPDPSNIRSKFARFDPRLANLSNLSAGVAGAGAVGLAAQSRQPEERRELPPLAPELAFMKDIYR